MEHYAYSDSFSKSQLHQLWVKRGLQTTKSTGKLYLTFIEKTFRDYRLYFYAGYIYYPEWEINTPIEGKHKPLVSLEVIKKIMEKETHKNSFIRSSNLDKNLEIHLLKGLITCSYCRRKLGCYASH